MKEERMKIKSLVIFSALLLLTAACSVNHTMTSSSSMPGVIVGPAYSDSDIAAIVTNANQGEIDQGQVASTKANSDDVRAFARMMVTDHTNALNQAQSLLSRTNIVANDNDISRGLQNASQGTVSALNTYAGTDFDRTYINSQVDIHQWLLNTLDNTLIPSANNRQLRDFLKTQRTAVATHLDRGKQIQSNLR
jgi:putative membrane protein